jgi:hypothetical protein
VGLSTQVIDLARLNLADDMNKAGGISKITMVQEEFDTYSRRNFFWLEIGNQHHERQDQKKIPKI